MTAWFKTIFKTSQLDNLQMMAKTNTSISLFFSSHIIFLESCHPPPPTNFAPVGHLADGYMQRTRASRAQSLKSSQRKQNEPVGRPEKVKKNWKSRFEKTSMGTAIPTGKCWSKSTTAFSVIKKQNCHAFGIVGLNWTSTERKRTKIQYNIWTAQGGGGSFQP